MFEMILPYHDPMLRIIEVRQYTKDGSERVRSAWHYAARQPSWIARIAAMVFLFIIMLPIVALMLIAIILAAIVFLALALANGAIGAVRSIFPKRDGRENVRVVRREE